MKILGVDDSQTMRRIVAMAVKSAGYEFEEAGDGREALDKAKAGHYDGFLVDVNMPIMGGIEFVTELRKVAKYAKTPVVIVTTENEVAMKDKGIKAGANDWIIKPFEREQLLAILKRLMPKVSP